MQLTLQQKTNSSTDTALVATNHKLKFPFDQIDAEMSQQQSAQALARLLSNLARYSIGLGLLGGAVQTSLYNVDGGERAVLFDRFRGVLGSTTGEGTHFLIPIIQRPYIMDIRTRPRSLSSVTGTKDLQMVNMTVRVLSKPKKEALPTIFQNLGLDWDERVLPSIGTEVVKAVVAQYNAEHLITERDKVSKAIRESLTARAKEFNILLDDVAITHLSFGTEFTKAVEAKQVAEQEAERMKFVVLKADQERIAAVTRAEGESEAAKLISEATTKAGPGFIELRRIEAAREVAETMSKSRNVIYLPSQGNLLLNVGAGANQN
eukprot:g3507.t1